MEVRTCLILLAICIETYLCTDNPYYTAAVIEYHPVDDRSYTPEQRTVENAKRYVDLLKSIDQPLDIAVFPEDTITHGIFSNDRTGILDISPILNLTAAPCENPDDYPRYFVDLSCAARELKTYLVANIVEKSVCSTDRLSDVTRCSADDFNLYNCDVVFDRDGAVIARYRKFHLFREPVMNVTMKAELSTFTTDFGVTFGMFTCFDVMFDEPSLLLVRRNVKHFVYPSMWFSEAPFLTAMQAQNMWAIANDAVLLASGANKPFIGSGGTGIYAGTKGPLIMGTVPRGGNKIFLHKIPKTSPDLSIGETNKRRDNEEIDKIATDMDGFHLSPDKLSPYKTYLIEDNIDTTYCHDDFCCHFKVSVSKNATTTDNFYRYRAVVYSGVRTFDRTRNNGIQVCAVVFCKDDTIESCGQRILPYGSIEWGTRFDEITISGTYYDENTMQYPSTLLSDVQPLSSDCYEWRSSVVGADKYVARIIRLVKPQERLMTFGIYGRDFRRDDAETFVDKYRADSNTL